MKTLLQQAKEVAVKRKHRVIGDQEVELALSWARGEVTTHQVNKALTGKDGGMTAYVFLSQAFQRFVKENGL